MRARATKRVVHELIIGSSFGAWAFILHNGHITVHNKSLALPIGFSWCNSHTNRLTSPPQPHPPHLLSPSYVCFIYAIKAIERIASRPDAPALVHWLVAVLPKLSASPKHVFGLFVCLICLWVMCVCVCGRSEGIVK